MKKVIATLIFVCMSFSAVQAQYATIPDSNLKRALNNHLGNGYVTDDILITDLENATGDLHAEADSITSLVGIQHCINLRAIYLSNNTGLQDLSPLSGLIDLESLLINECAISDLTPLSGLAGLKSLVSGGGQHDSINDVSPLAGLTNLETLVCANVQITDISPLSGLTSLEVLYLFDNQISDITAILGMVKLHDLQLYDNELANDDLSNLYDLDQMWCLRLDGNSGINDACAIQRLANNLDNMDCEDIVWDGSCDSCTNNPPYTPSNPSPSHEAVNQTEQVNLSWEGGDPEDDLVTYDIYFGTSNPPTTLVSDDQLATTYDPGTLTYNTTYYWQVVASDGLEIAEGPVWSFTVQAPPTTTPSVRTWSAQSISETSSTLRGYLADDGGLTCQVRFCYWADGQNEQVTSWKEDSGPFSESVTNLTPSTHYTFYAQAKNDLGTVTGSTRNFTTLGPSNTLIIIPGTGGKDDEGSTQEVPDGECITIKAEPKSDLFEFSHWTIEPPEAGTLADPNAAETTLCIYDDLIVRPWFFSLLDILHVDDDAPDDPCHFNLAISDPCEDGTDDHPFDAIQEAIDVARQHVKVLVRPGTYYETLNFLDKNIDVNSFDPNLADEILPFPVIDANNTGTVLTFDQEQDPNCILSGFVIKRGYGKQAGAIALLEASPQFHHCIIVANRVHDPNEEDPNFYDPNCAVIYCRDSNSLFNNVTIHNNYGGPEGSILRFVDCNVVITNSILWDNTPAMDFIVEEGNDPNVMYCDLSSIWPGVGNIVADPCFADPGLWVDVNCFDFIEDVNTIIEPNQFIVEPNDPNAIWLEGDYHLKSTQGRYNPIDEIWVYDLTDLGAHIYSPCLDAGDPNAVWEPEPEVFWPPYFPPIPDKLPERLNMGAYGGTNQASMIISTESSD